MDSFTYIEGFLDGQAVAYCERVNTGMSLAAQLDCPADYRERVFAIATQEGCKVLDDTEDQKCGRASLWIYRDDLAAKLIAELKSAHATSEFGMWTMGRLLGYANHDVSAFINRVK
ncbi:MAG: hypothetical protein HYX27_14095 [Acidobacteria bacterium]|nr:hypothetical protein [Acidobacteriota bacterium]